MRRALILLVAVGLVGCEEKPAPPLSSLKPKPLPKLTPVAAVSTDGGDEAEREALFQVAPAEVYGEQVPPAAVPMRVSADGVLLSGEKVKLNPERAEDAAKLKAKVMSLRPEVVLLEVDPDVYLAQASALLAVLSDAGAGVWLQHSTSYVAYELTLRDEPGFRAWLEEAKPGKIRIIQREDGLELSTNMGKLPGADPNGPTLPLRGGKLDVAAERAALEKLKGRFKDAPDICLVPSFGTEFSRMADVLSGTYRAMGEGIFAERCLVFPRPHAKDH